MRIIGGCVLLVYVLFVGVHCGGCILLVGVHTIGGCVLLVCAYY